MACCALKANIHKNWCGCGNLIKNYKFGKIYFFPWISLFHSLGNHDRLQYFHITPVESNVETVTEKVRNGFDNANLILVQSNGYKIEDNEATRGMY